MSKEFHKKHKPLEEGSGSFVSKADLKKKTVNQAMHEMEEAQKKFQLNMAEAEKNLTDYLKISDPIVVDGKPIFWVRRPSMKEIKALTPNKAEMAYMENPEEMPTKMQKEYDERFYVKISELVTAPKKTPDEWRDVMNPWILRLFWGYIAKVGNILGAEVEGF